MWIFCCLFFFQKSSTKFADWLETPKRKKSTTDFYLPLISFSE